jgi:transcriptional regulator with AAA-type ATPase domain
MSGWRGLRPSAGRRARAGWTTLPRMAPGPLVGRDTRLGELRAAACHVAAGEAPVVLVAGEPGIGKTRLVAELAAGAPCPVLVGRADPEVGAPPLWPWLR